MSDESRNPHRRWASEVLKRIATQLAGLDEIVRLGLIAYCTGGHVLLEGNPGLGKTTLVKRLAEAIGLQEGRIQFTPDLMPADITGTMLPNYRAGGAGEWAFDPGPIFASILLADEINRATPKTQSALLEAMAEGQVTVLGQTYRLPQPFVVMATQNPLDHTGTYALPEAQSDRFMFKLIMPIPDRTAVDAILTFGSNRAIVRDQQGRPASANGGELPSARRTLFAAFNPDHVRSAGHDPRELTLRKPYDEASAAFERRARVVERIELQPAVQQHLINMFQASNKRYEGQLVGLNNEQRGRLKLLVETLFSYGLGPRAVINLAKAARAWALFFGTTNVVEEDLRADAVDLARILVPILRHRVKLHFGWEEQYKDLARRSPLGASALDGDMLATLLADFALSTAPSDRRMFGEYYGLMRAALGALLNEGSARR